MVIAKSPLLDMTKIDYLRKKHKFNQSREPISLDVQYVELFEKNVK